MAIQAPRVSKSRAAAEGPKNMIGPLVKRAREEIGWSQSELAARCQLAGFDASKATIGHIEMQIRKVSDIEFALIAKALGKPLTHPFVPQEIPEWKLRPWRRS